MRIASVGDNCVDLYENADQKVYVGGNSVNLAIAIRRSKENCSYIGMVGNDTYGMQIKEVLAREKIDTTRIVTVNGSTAWTKVRLQGNDRIFYEENLGVQQHYNITTDQMLFIANHDLVHYSAFTNWPTACNGGIENYYDLVKDHISNFFSQKLPISMDFSDGEVTKLLDITSGKIEIGFFSRPGLDSDHLQEEARKLLAYGFKLVVLTRGREGSCAFNGIEMICQPAYQVEVIDTLGAGDAFIGSFLSRYVRHQTIKESLKYASWYAAQVCTRLGGY